MQTHDITWRTFADSEPIMERWNAPQTPSFYLIDHRGIIRHKWIGHPGEKAIDQALQKWIRAAGSKD